MKKVFLIMIAALCLAAVGCKKTCQCTETVTITYDPDYWGDDEPDVSSANYTKEAKKCSDLNAEANVNQLFANYKTVVECK
jgi:hypothetical protein